MPRSRWIPPSQPEALWRVFYDGDCALCHGFVRFLLKRDRRPQPIRYGPLQGDVFRAIRAEGGDWPDPLPDSLAMIGPDGILRFRSDGVLRILGELGGIWRPLAAIGQLVPRRLRDFVYDRVAHVRKRIFGTTDAHCPVVPTEWRDRFLL